MEDVLLKFIDMVSNLAPDVWEVYLRQVQVAKMQTIVILVSCVMAIVFLSIWMVRVRTKYIRSERDSWSDDMDNMPLYIIGGFTVLGCIMGAVACINSIIGYSINPSYYAIQALLSPLSR